MTSPSEKVSLVQITEDIRRAVEDHRETQRMVNDVYTALLGDLRGNIGLQARFESTDARSEHNRRDLKEINDSIRSHRAEFDKLKAQVESEEKRKLSGQDRAFLWGSVIVAIGSLITTLISMLSQ